MEFLEITKAQYVGDHKIHLWFNNNVDRVVDFSDKLKGAAFEPLRDLTFLSNSSKVADNPLSNTIDIR